MASRGSLPLLRISSICSVMGISIEKRRAKPSSMMMHLHWVWDTFYLALKGSRTMTHVSRSKREAGKEQGVNLRDLT